MDSQSQIVIPYPIDALGSSSWFSTLDLKSGFHQVGIADGDTPKTVFASLTVLCGSGVF